MRSFSRKRIETCITLAAGSFGAQGNRKIIRDLATDVSIQKPGLPDKNSAAVSISNLKYDDIAELTTLGFRAGETRRNLIEIVAGDDQTGLSSVFRGEIISAYGDFNAVPDPSLVIEAISGYFPDIVAEAPATYQGQVLLADIIADIARRIGYGFDNQGVTASLRNAVLNGSPVQKAIAAARQAGVNLLIDNDTFILLPAGQARRGNAVLLRDDSGLIGYPTFNQDGVSLSALFDPAFEYGGLIRIESVVPKATGVWRITKLSHKLSAHMTSGGKWLSSIEAAYLSEG